MVAQPVAAPTEQFVSSPLDSITAAEYPRLVEHVGYLKDLGLDYGWGPTSLLQNLLENVHIYTGTGWGVSIILTSLLVRLVLLKTYINASDVSARVATINPNVAPIKARLKEAKAARDTDQMRVITAELRDLYSVAGIKMWKIFVPMLQVPLGFGTFRLMRGMADLPVPGLDEAGLFWLTDLTLPDPYFILPIFTGLAFHVTFSKGGELATQMTDEAWKTTMLYGVPLLTSCFMLFWPGALQLTFAFTSILSLLQSYLLRQPWMRNFLNIQPLPIPKPAGAASPYAGTITQHESTPSTPPVKKGVLGGAISDIKGAASQVVKTARNLRDSPDAKRGSRRRSPAEVKRAQDYEARRQREIAKAKLETKRSSR